VMTDTAATTTQERIVSESNQPKQYQWLRATKIGVFVPMFCTAVERQLGKPLR
jgi:hypothetical protein